VHHNAHDSPGIVRLHASAWTKKKGLYQSGSPGTRVPCLRWLALCAFFFLLKPSRQKPTRHITHMGLPVTRQVSSSPSSSSSVPSVIRKPVEEEGEVEEEEDEAAEGGGRNTSDLFMSCL
jgi:hypothetical protein